MRNNSIPTSKVSIHNYSKLNFIIRLSMIKFFLLFCDHKKNVLYFIHKKNDLYSCTESWTIECLLGSIFYYYMFHIYIIVYTTQMFHKDQMK